MRRRFAWIVGLGLAAAGLAGAAGAAEWIPLAKGNQWSYRTEDDVQYKYPDRPIVRNFWAGTATEYVEGAQAAAAGEPRRYLVSRQAMRPVGIEAAPSATRFLQTLSMGRQGLRLHAFQTLDAPSPLNQPVRYAVPLLLLPAELELGRSWQVGAFVIGNAAVELGARAVAREDVTVGAGRYPGAWVVRLEGPISGSVDVVGEWAEVGSGRFERTWWIAPGVGILRERTEMTFEGLIGESTPVRGHTTSLRELLSHRREPGAALESAPPVAAESAPRGMR